jgi:NAD(P)-dependent dehydrogenase (short-subunit alcohol dehydrogenase family)
MHHPVLSTGRVAVVTGAASGIGLSAAKNFASLGMRICMVDVAEDALDSKREQVVAAAAGGGDDVLAVAVDVAHADQVMSLKETVYDTFGEVGLLMNNAVTRIGGGIWESDDDWRRTMDVNLWGVINAVRAFVPSMVAQATPGFVVNTGSKQGITNPPGNIAYNVSKAALKTYTEALQHELRNTQGCRIGAHLLVPGWTTTRDQKHVPGAWMPQQVVDVMLAALERGDFYIICPDDEVTTEMDNKRFLWAAGDMVANRPALSRWHPDYCKEFEKYSR